MLVRRVGVRHIDLVEDAVQCALMSALGVWTEQGLPHDPSAWLYKVAYNRLIQDLRRGADRAKVLARNAGDVSDATSHLADPRFADEIHDDMLRMLFVCCDEAIPHESRLVLALKALCGFSTAEIALRLFTSEANVLKRLSRARDRLCESLPDLETLPLEKLRGRVQGVQAVLYLLFNEGYLSTRADQALRRELCDEALRLAALLAEHPVGAVPETFALLALMHLHVARMASRVDATGGLLLLEEQDRSLWDRESIRTGLAWLERSASGQTFSRFHAEAGIAAEHCLAPTYADTRWREIVDLYVLLERIAPSPLHAMNRAVAIAEWQGPDAGLAVLAERTPPTWLSCSYLWHAALADLHRRAEHSDIAREQHERAMHTAPTAAVRRLLQRRLEALGRRQCRCVANRFFPLIGGSD